MNDRQKRPHRVVQETKEGEIFVGSRFSRSDLLNQLLELRFSGHVSGKTGKNQYYRTVYAPPQNGKCRFERDSSPLVVRSRCSDLLRISHPDVFHRAQKIRVWRGFLRGSPCTRPRRWRWSGAGFATAPDTTRLHSSSFGEACLPARARRATAGSSGRGSARRANLRVSRDVCISCAR